MLFFSFILELGQHCFIFKWWVLSMNSLWCVQGIIAIFVFKKKVLALRTTVLEEKDKAFSRLMSINLPTSQ